MQIYGEITPVSAVSLPRYAQMIGYTECAFFGVARSNNVNYACREIWTKAQRDSISAYLMQAQDELESILQYPLQQKWFSDEEHPFSLKVIANNGHIISSGVRKEDVISDGAVVTLSDISGIKDPCEIVLSYDLTGVSLSEIHIFYPGVDVEIIPSRIFYIDASKVLTIEIPRCRLVAYDKLNNPDEGLDYTLDENFQSTVDVHRIYTDSSVQAKLFYKDNACSSCNISYDSACQTIIDSIIGTIDVVPSNGYRYRDYIKMALNYSAGISTLTRGIESAIIRLAHSMMPSEPCGCEISQGLWRRDRFIPQILTKERIDCPFGLSDGAWFAWKWACDNELKRISIL